MVERLATRIMWSDGYTCKLSEHLNQLYIVKLVIIISYEF